MIRAIIFDCFGVLTADSWHEFRLNLNPDLQKPASELNRQYCEGAIDKKQFLESVSKLTGQPEESIGQIIDNESDKNHQLLDYIAQLKPRYKIGLLSNVANGWIRDEFLDPKEQSLFDDYVFSFEVGLTKPDPHIYKLAAEHLELATTECVFIDDIEQYCIAAEAAGMKAINYQSFEQMKTELEVLLANTDN